MKYFFLLWLNFVAFTMSAALIDAAFPMYETRVMFVQGDKLIQFDMASNTVLKTSYLSKNGLPGVTFQTIDAALNYGNGKVYLFSGTQYVKFDITTFKAEGDPKSTAQYWPGVNFTSIDAAMQWPGKSYFFSGTQYTRFNCTTNNVDAGYPKTISSVNWVNVPFSKFEAAFDYAGKSYFFNGDNFVQYDIALDKMDNGYPKKIESWPGLAAALGRTVTPPSPSSSSSTTKPLSWNETKLTLSLGEKRTSFYSRASVEFDANKNPVMIYGLEKDGSYIQSLNRYWMPTSNPIPLKGLYFWDFLIVGGNYYVLAKEHAGYKGVGPLDYETEGNVLVILKIKPDGTIVYKKNLFGHEGVTGGSKFLCTYSSHGNLAFDGTYFHAFVETCGNFTAKGASTFDVHEGDYYLTFDMNGDVRPDGRRIWNHSHSNLLQLLTDGAGEAYTLEVSDGGPWGINFNRYSNGKEMAYKTIFPDPQKLPYKDMYAAAEATTDAGEIGGMVQFGDYFYTVIATVPVERHPIKQQSKDLLFCKFDRSGNQIAQNWIRLTPNVNESRPHIIAYGDKILMINLVQTGKYEADPKGWISVLNLDGTYALEPKKTSFDVDWQSQLMKFPNGDIGVFTAKFGTTAEIVRLGVERLPNRLDPDDAKNMTGATPYKNATIKPLMPEYARSSGTYIDFRKKKEDNLQFEGSYYTSGTLDPVNGLYADGVYSTEKTAATVAVNEFDYKNFKVEAEFKVDELREGVVFCISRGYRTLEYVLKSDGRLQLRLNNGKIRQDIEASYKLNTWHTAKVEALGESITVYLDGVVVLKTSASLITEPGRKGVDILTTSYNSGIVFKGFLRSIRIGQAQ